jgi:hypothetical protein
MDLLNLCGHGLDLISLGGNSLYGDLVLPLAQTFKDDLGSNFQDAWSNFIESGQVWALGIGFFLGYIFRSLTSY